MNVVCNNINVFDKLQMQVTAQKFVSSLKYAAWWFNGKWYIRLYKELVSIQENVYNMQIANCIIILQASKIYPEHSNV